MPCSGRGRTGLWIVLIAGVVGASLLTWDAVRDSGGDGTPGTVVLWLGWFGAMFAAFAAPSSGCRCRAMLSRLAGRRRAPENPYRDADGHNGRP